MTFKIVGISGSLRKNSTNTRALEAVQKLQPSGFDLEIVDISDVPLFNADLHALGEPASVVALKAKIEQADAVLIASPEYNFSVPGVLKNALDWVSRPPVTPLSEKPVAIIGVSPGPVGTARMQYHLRQILVFMNTFTLNKPEIFINHSGQKFNEQGELVDQPTQTLLREQLIALKALAERVAMR